MSLFINLIGVFLNFLLYFSSNTFNRRPQKGTEREKANAHDKSTKYEW